MVSHSRKFKSLILNPDTQFFPEKSHSRLSKIFHSSLILDLNSQWSYSRRSLIRFSHPKQWLWNPNITTTKFVHSAPTRWAFAGRSHLFIYAEEKEIVNKASFWITICSNLSSTVPYLTCLNVGFDTGLNHILKSQSASSIRLCQRYERAPFSWPSSRIRPLLSFNPRTRRDKTEARNLS